MAATVATINVSNETDLSNRQSPKAVIRELFQEFNFPLVINVQMNCVATADPTTAVICNCEISQSK